MTLSAATVSIRAASAIGLALGYGLDRLLGDPRRWHPVAGLGRLACWWERRIYADDRRAGVGYVTALVGGIVVVGAAGEWATRSAPLSRLLLTAAATWAVLGGRTLEREADTVAGQLRGGDVPAARAQIRSLVGRDPEQLDQDGLARACVESVAENTSDAVVAPLLWGALAGLPGLLGYRAANTLDAMVGHRSPRYADFGWASARLDDLVNWLPARLTAVLAVIAAGSVGGRPRQALLTMIRDGRHHPSPNAGVVEAAFAGALGVRLGGRNVYRGVVETRGRLGNGPAPTSADIVRVVRLATTTSRAALAAAVGLRLARVG